MNRRDFVWTTGVASAGLAFPWRRGERGWRTFEVTTHVEVLKPSGTTRIWVPAALVRETPYQKTLANTFDAAGGKAKLVQRAPDALGIIAAEFPAGIQPLLNVTSRFSTRNHTVDLSAVPRQPTGGREDLKHFLRPTKLLPTNGIVKATADQITHGAATDLDKARAIYERSEEHTSELQSLAYLVCRLLLEKKKKTRPPVRPLTEPLRPTR